MSGLHKHNSGLAKSKAMLGTVGPVSRARVAVRLKWRPREENTIADDITNSVFDQVDLSKRITISYADLPVQIIHALYKSKAEFDRARESQRTIARSQALRVAGMKRKRADKTPW